MVKSYEEATEENAGEDDSNPGPEAETDVRSTVDDLRDEFGDVENRVEGVPDWLKPESAGRRDDMPDVGGQRGSFGIDVDLGDLEGMSDAGLLEVVARVSIAQLATLFDIADAVQPFQNITVSGVNAIDEANTTEPVVPQSDDEQIPTRTLFMRANEDNTDKIYIGDDEVAPQSGLVLGPGEFYAIESDLRAEEFYMASETAGQSVQLLGLV